MVRILGGVNSEVLRHVISGTHAGTQDALRETGRILSAPVGREPGLGVSKDSNLHVWKRIFCGGSPQRL